MNNAPAGCHPLNVTFPNHTLVTGTILMFHFTGKGHGDGFKTSMGVLSDPTWFANLGIELFTVIYGESKKESC